MQAQQTKAKGLPGTVVAHQASHAKVYIGSPSIAILPNGDYLAAHDFFGEDSSEWTATKTAIYRSKNRGEAWKLETEIMGAFWSSLFVHKNNIYLLGTDRHFGNVVIRKSTDNGTHWTEPRDENSGLLLTGEYHTSAVPVVVYEGRIWRALETASGVEPDWGKRFGAMMISAPANTDLLKAANWTTSHSLPYHSAYLNGNFNGWLEGNAVVAPNGEIYNILRVDDKTSLTEKVALVSVDKNGLLASFDQNKDFVDFPGGSKKFTIRYDQVSASYWALVNNVPERHREAYHGQNPSLIRNTLSLISSSDLRNWTIRKEVLHHPNADHYGFQYADWVIDGNDLIFLSRTTWPDSNFEAGNSRQSKYLTFHKIFDFRALLNV
ncbi:sialidase family protein [Pedobacter endophyticus]|uniref:Exo-alpha-sialidase n=1 Tax=Pedobacter endophyticus TaxID=2789740 RepID=A0A7S9L0Z6_9SPHI|nr:sialidase family protein [Pedobacter endophyticus]QPH40494.1 exo-alpha-sialidase [Pedobacter endophyticus]